MNFKRFQTCLKIDKIPEDKMGSILNVMEDLSFLNYDGDVVPLGYMHDRKENHMKIPGGYCIDRLASHLVVDTHQLRKTPIKHIEPRFKTDFEMRFDPFDYQNIVTQECLDHFLNITTTNQFIIDLPTGTGKSFTAINICRLLKVPTLIIVKETKLRDNWIKDIVKNTTIRREEIYALSGIGAKTYVDSMSVPHPFFIITHASVRSIIDKIGYVGFNNMIYRMGIGCKIIDEFDLEFRNILDIDLNSAVKYNLYLTATVFKSSKKEDVLFQKVYKRVPRRGRDLFEEDEDHKNRIAEFVYFHSHPTFKEIASTKSWGRKEFNSFKYNRYLFNKRPDLIAKIIKPYINEFENEYFTEDNHKCVLYVEMIDSCGIMYDILHTKLGIPKKDIGMVNSKMDERYKNLNMSKKYIITTVKSFGRGLDIKIIRYIINFESYASKSIFQQHGGRIGRVGGALGKFVNFCDVAFRELIIYDNAKKAKWDEVFKSYKKSIIDHDGNISAKQE